MFALLISDHRFLQNIIIPCVLEKSLGKDFYVLQEIITRHSGLFDTLTGYEQTIVDFCSRFDDKNLSKVYNKRKLPVKQFIENVDPKLFSETIRPFIDKMIVKCLTIAVENNVPLYLRKNNNINFLQDDIIKISNVVPELIFNFERTPEGLQYHQTITVGKKEMNLYGKFHRMLSVDPCRIVIDNVLYAIENIDSAKLLPFFTKKTITIPKHLELNYFQTFVSNAVANYKVNAKGFEIVEIREMPLFSITIVPNLEGRQSLFVNVFYWGYPFEINKENVYHVRLEQDTFTFYKIFRNSEEENKFLEQLFQNGLAFDKCGFLCTKSGEDIYNWLSLNIQMFSKDNCRLMFDSTKRVVTEIPRIEVKVDASSDWFDLKSYVIVGNKKIPFSAFKKHVLEKIPEFVIDDSTVFIIPEEWFSRYNAVFSFSTQTDETIRLHKHHLAVFESFGENVDISNLISNQPENIAVPIGLKGKLRPYQESGYQWLYDRLKFGVGCCLADDMGLGKTLQAIALLLKQKEDSIVFNDSKPPINKTGVPVQLSLFENQEEKRSEKTVIGRTNLIVMPASLIHNWYNEIKRFAPSLTVYKYSGGERTQSIQTLTGFDVILTTYGYARNDIELLGKTTFYTVILDESQTIKNPYSKTYECLCRLNSVNKIVLTGTPVENKLLDLWSQIHFINRGMLGNVSQFKSKYVDNSDDPYKFNSLKQVVKPFILRRNRYDVLPDLPAKQEQVIWCKMTDFQKKLYEQEKSKIRNELMTTMYQSGKKTTVSLNILHAMLRLRQIANHPVLCEKVDMEESGKFEEILRSIESVTDEGHKVLIFSSFVAHLELVKAHLDTNNINYSWLTGSTNNRESVIEEFKTDESRKVFLISIKAGGVGLNLTEADYVFILDPWWNPAVEEQAIGRSHRMGQKQKVFVYRFITEQSIEEKIVNLQKKKSKLASIIENEEENSSLTVDDIQYLLE